MKKQLLNLKTMALALGMLISGSLSAFTAVTSGNWSSAATWGGSAPGSTVSNNDVIIPAGITVTLDQDVTFSGLLSTFSVSGTLSSTSNNWVLLTQGALAGGGTISIHRIAFSNLATASFSGSMTVSEFVNSSSILGFVSTVNVTDSLILADGSLSLNNNSNLTMMSNSTIKVDDGSMSIGGGVFTSSNSYNVMYVGTSKSGGVELNGTGLQNLYIKMNSNSETVTMSGNTTLNNSLNIMTGKFSLGGRKLTLNGDLFLSAGTSITSNSTSELAIQGNGPLSNGLVFTSGSVINNLSIGRPGATVKLMSGLNLSGTLHMLNGNLSLESGSSLTMNAGSMIHIGDGSLMVNTGSFVGTASYDVEYNGAGNAGSGIELSGPGLNNVTVNYSNIGMGVSLSNSLTVNGKLDMQSGHLRLNGQNLVLNGTVSQNQNSTFVGNSNSELWLNLTSVSNTTLYFDNTSAANNTISKLRLNLAGSNPVMLGSQLTVANELTFVKGKIMIDNGDLVMNSSATITGYDNNRYVVTTGTGMGRLQMNVTAGGSFVTFPIGTNNNYSPAYIQQTSAATSGNVMVKAMNDVLTGGTYGQVNSTSMPLVGRTWFIEASSGVTVNMNIKLGWVAAAELNGFNRNTAMIRHYTNGSWDTYTSSSATTGVNSTFELMRGGITSLSPFAVADASAPLSVKNNSGAVGFELYPNPAKDVLVLELATTMRGYKYQVADITGKTIKEGNVSKNTSAVDVSALKPGYYFITITNLDDNVSGVKRFVKD